MRRRLRRALAAVALALFLSDLAYAFESRVAEIRAVGPSVRAAVDLKDPFPEKFQQILQAGSPLYVRMQVELWEDRAMWDRLVRPGIVTVFRIGRDPASATLDVSDAFGRVLSVAGFPASLTLRVDVAPADAVSDANHYYLRVNTTIGTIAERDVKDADEAVFGRDDGSISLGKVGRFIFHAVVQMSDYLQSVSSEAKSRVFAGRELRPGLR